MQLRAALMELLHQFGDVGADGSGIDAGIVGQILDGHLGEEIAEAAQLILVIGHPVKRVVPQGAETVDDLIALQLEPQRLIAAPLALEQIAQVRRPIFLRQLFLEPGKTLQHPRHLQVRGLLGAVATGMGQGEVAGVVLAAHLQGHHMVDVDLILVHHQVHVLLADEAMPVLGLMQLLNELLALFRIQAIQVQRRHDRFLRLLVFVTR